MSEVVKTLKKKQNQAEREKLQIEEKRKHLEGKKRKL